jgi:hypothetical protein
MCWRLMPLFLTPACAPELLATEQHGAAGEAAHQRVLLRLANRKVAKRIATAH